MRWLTDLVDHLPERWRRRAQQYGVWVVLAASVSLLWYFDGRKELIAFDRFAVRSPSSNAAGILGYVIGFLSVGLIRFPQRLLPFLIMLWALAIVHYRYLFVRFALPGGRRSKLIYAGLMLLLRWALVTGVTAWLGFAGLSDSLVNIWLVFALFYALLAHFRWLRRIRRQLTAQKTRAELDALKAQINPHFLFNSLNNIFGTALTENGPRTADSVQQLARILRYMLEQAHADRAGVGAELQFLDEYVTLQKQRLPAQTTTDVQFGYEWDEEPAQVAPLLLSPLLDYAFRQTIDAQNGGTGFLHASAVVQARQLHLVLDYTCPNCRAEQADELQNVRQRLALIYPNHHRMNLSENGPIAHLELTINLN